MNIPADWEVEIQHLLGIFERESTISLTKISRSFLKTGRPFDEEFRQYFLKVSTVRLDTCFDTVSFERRFESQEPTTPNMNTPVHGKEIISDADISNPTEDNAPSQNGQKNENALELNAQIEIVDSDDDDDGKEYSGKRAVDNTIGSHNESNASASLDTKNDGQSPDGEHDGSDSREENVIDVDVKREPKIENEIESVDLPMVEFDPNKANDDSSIENGVDDADRNQSSSSSNASEQQMKRNTLKRFKCTDCSFTSQQKGNVKRHRMIHGKGKPFKCEHCDYACRQKGHLQRHQLIHQGIKPFKCERCDFACRQRSDLEKHQRIHDGEKLMGIVRDLKYGTYKCPHCDQEFIEFKFLSSHVKKTHKNNRRLFNCSRCMRRFARKNEKDTHETRCQARRYECYLCKKYVTRAAPNMQKHMRTHSGAKPFECAICNKFFRQKVNLKGHLKRQHSRA